MWWSDSWPMPWMFMGPAAMFLIVIACMVMMIVMMRGGIGHRHQRHDAIDVLKERFARGEINQAEYEERRRVLQS